MIWLFERGNDVVRLETKLDKESGEYTLAITWADGTTTNERYAGYGEFHARVLRLEEQLDAEHWSLTGPPTIMPTQWQGP